MKRILFLFLLFSAAFALDVRREAAYFVGNTTLANYTEYIYGPTADAARAEIDATSELAFVNSIFPIQVSHYSLNYSSDSLVVRADGVYPHFIQRLGSVYIIGEFVYDRFCLNEIPNVPPFEKEFITAYFLPANWSVVSLPKNVTKNAASLQYNFTSWVKNGAVHQYIFLKVKENMGIQEYCAELDKLNALQMNLLVDPRLAMHVDLKDLFYAAVAFLVLLLCFRHVVEKNE